MIRLCKAPNCDVRHFCKGYCRVHYGRWKRHGDPLKVLKALSPRGAPMAWLRANGNYAGDDCLIWPFSRMPDGRAHMNGAFPSRVMCELAHGEAPSRSHEAAHSCGRGHDACVSPRHLRWATPTENAADKVLHGTVILGERHYASKLSEADVREIRSLATSVPQKDLAQRFGVRPVCINKIVHRHSWRHVA